MSYKKSYKKSNDENNLEDFTEVELQGKHDLLKANSVMKWMENMENLLDLLLSQGRGSEKDINRQMYFVCNIYSLSFVTTLSISTCCPFICILRPYLIGSNCTPIFL